MPPRFRLRDALDQANRIVVKVGSALVVDKHSHQPRQDWLNTLSDDINMYRAQGKEIILVSSGAIALARGECREANGRIDAKQALATIGQPMLMEVYQKAFRAHVPQILLCADDLRDKTRRENFIATTRKLYELGKTPIINENDAVATEEIKFGDNDRLAALVARAVQADALVLLTRAGGLFTGDPEGDEPVEHIPYVPEVTDEFRAFATGTKDHLSTGGMESKLEAATVATKAGIPTFVGSGLSTYPLTALASEQRGSYTTFAPVAA